MSEFVGMKKLFAMLCAKGSHAPNSRMSVTSSLTRTQVTVQWRTEVQVNSDLTRETGNWESSETGETVSQ